MTNDHSSGAMDRREILMASVATAIGGTASSVAASGSGTRAAPATAMSPGNSITLRVNGQTHVLSVDPRTTLLDLLREHLELGGTKKGCDHGQCGACTVILEGHRINSCLTLAVMHDGESVTTVEGLATGDELHAMQAAFVRHDGFQCGYCTPGQICSAVAMLDEVARGAPSHVSEDLMGRPAVTDDEIRERMSGNLCRCAAYPNIVAAIRDAAGHRS